MSGTPITVDDLRAAGMSPEESVELRRMGVVA